MRTETTTRTIYKFDELSPDAQQHALEEQSQIESEYFDYEYIFDDAATIADLFGLDLDTQYIPLMSGSTRPEPTIYYSGFSCQGDGACFEAHYRYRKGAPKALRDYAPHDEALHRIADALQVVQRRNFFQLRAEATHGGRYYHEYCMSISVDRDSPTWQPMTDGAEEAVTEALRDLARWLYRQLEREYEHLTSDEAIDESIAANDYTFTEAGCRFG